MKGSCTNTTRSRKKAGTLSWVHASYHWLSTIILYTRHRQHRSRDGNI